MSAMMDMMMMILMLGGGYYVAVREGMFEDFIGLGIESKGGGGRGGSGGSGGGSGGGSSGGGTSAGGCPSLPGSAYNPVPSSGSIKVAKGPNSGVFVQQGTASVSNGIVTLGGKSPRLYMSGNFTSNVELSAYFQGNPRVIELVAPSNHEDANGFGGYALYLNGGTEMFYKKEETHEKGYTGRLAQKKVSKGSGWFGMKTVVTTEGSNVRMVGCFDNGSGWQKITEVVDSGNLQGKQFTGKAKWVFIRSDDPGNLKVRNIQVKTGGGGGGKQSALAQIPVYSGISKISHYGNFSYVEEDDYDGRIIP